MKWRRDVRHFVPHDDRKICITLYDFENARVNGYFTARHGKCVDLLVIVKNDEFPRGIRHIRGGHIGDSLADATRHRIVGRVGGNRRILF